MSMGRVVMYNPRNDVKIITNVKFQSKWERLGFNVIHNNVVLFKLAV